MPRPEEQEGNVCQARDARNEARRLLPLLGENGDTPETVRELIRVSPEEQAALRAFLMADRVEQILAYRVRVEQEFEQLARAAH